MFASLKDFLTQPKSFQRLNRGEWERFRLGLKFQQVKFFCDLAKLFQSLERPELMEEPARMLITAAERQHWHLPGVEFHHLSQVMRFGRVAGIEAVRRFMDHICTPAWLTEQYEEGSSGSLAYALFGLWGYYEQPILDHFRIEALEKRLIVEMRCLSILTPEFLSPALQLLGCSALIGVCIKKAEVRWPPVSMIRNVIRLTTPESEAVKFGHIQIQLWLGLREMARLRSDRITVKADLGKQVLILWKNSAGYTNKQNLLNGWMIDWLERCAQSGWVLIPDQCRIAEAIASLHKP